MCARALLSLYLLRGTQRHRVIELCHYNSLINTVDFQTNYLNYICDGNLEFTFRTSRCLWCYFMSKDVYTDIGSVLFKIDLFNSHWPLWEFYYGPTQWELQYWVFPVEPLPNRRVNHTCLSCLIVLPFPNSFSHLTTQFSICPMHMPQITAPLIGYYILSARRLELL